MGKIQAVVDLWLPGQFGVSTAEKCRKSARRVYEDHYKEIRRVAPKGGLLEYKLGSGWEPLCRFLGKDVPDVPFPRVNESAMLERQLKIVGMKATKRSLKNMGTIISALVALGVGFYWAVSGVTTSK
jgi:hypothetical protein